jgi:UrcA family protein
MMKSKATLAATALAGALGFGLVFAGAAKAQNFQPSETVIVHQGPDTIDQSRGVVFDTSGHMTYAEQLSTSRAVNYSDIDLSRSAGLRELRMRISNTARDLCSEVASADPSYYSDTGETEQCVRTATADAMRRVIG